MLRNMQKGEWYVKYLSHVAASAFVSEVTAPFRSCWMGLAPKAMTCCWNVMNGARTNPKGASTKGNFVQIS